MDANARKIKNIFCDSLLVGVLIVDSVKEVSAAPLGWWHVQVQEIQLSTEG